MANHSGRCGHWPSALLFFAIDGENIMPLWGCKNDCSSPSILQDMISPEVSPFLLTSGNVMGTDSWGIDGMKRGQQGNDKQNCSFPTRHCHMLPRMQHW